ncbi:MAG: FAD-dependent oxidoreductase [Acidobacteriaceae bacterium]|nr:FAD-dependent oxidoreductase [Acidobacteriaceae bacterium]
MQKSSQMMPETDVLICGAGVMGLSLALELTQRGMRVAVLEQAQRGERAAGQASWAAAGMLAAEDPHNPPALSELARWSRSLYDAYLQRIEEVSGLQVRYQTDRTIQYLQDGASVELAEQSLNPRELMAALETAVEKTGIDVVRGVQVQRAETLAGSVKVIAGSESFAARQVVFAAGAWFLGEPAVRPRKGQMMRLRLAMDEVHRSAGVYVVPRRFGEQAGTVLVGATVEDAGFDTTVREDELQQLRRRAAQMVPAVADAEIVEAWAGLRPATVDGLPLLGELEPRQFVAGGHFRNGILLAPATAKAMADMLEGKPVVEMLQRFAPSLVVAQRER